jgi:hypothetical protein
MSGAAPDPNATITCRVTMWYYRRMGLLAAMFLGMGLYFLYDGRIGYPKENRVVAEKERFEREIIGSPEKQDREIESFEEAQQQGEEHVAAWLKMARERGWIVNPALNEPRWADYASIRGWSEDPKYHSPDKIREQYYFGGAMILGAAIAGLLVLRNHNKVLTGHPDHMVMPNGASVRYDQVTCVDKRKWDHKGLAHIHYRLAEGSPARRAVIDDLMYGGADKVLNRLLAQFSGELIEKVPEEEEAREPAVEPPSTGVTGHESPPKS